MKLHDLLLSCSRRDAGLSERLKADLGARGLRVRTQADRLPERMDDRRAIGLIITPRSGPDWLDSWREAASSLGTEGPPILPLLFGSVERPDFLDGHDCIDFSSEERYPIGVDRIIWPGLTGKRVIFVGVHPGRRAPWPRLRRGLQELGIRFVQGENLNRVRFHIRQIVKTGSYRVVVVVDIFEDWPAYRWPRRDDPRAYADLIFDLEDKTRGAQDEISVLLYHHSTAFEQADCGLDSGRLARLESGILLHSDLPDEALKDELERVWLRLQRRLLGGEVAADDGV